MMDWSSHKVHEIIILPFIPGPAAFVRDDESSWDSNNVKSFYITTRFKSKNSDIKVWNYNNETNEKFIYNA